MTKEPEKNPLLSPDHELPAPHDMLISSGTPTGPGKVKPSSLSPKQSSHKWILYLIPFLIVLIFGVSIYSLNQQKQEEESTAPIRAVNVTPKVKRDKKK